MRCVKGYLRQKLITTENLIIEIQFKNLYFKEKSCYFLEIFIFFNRDLNRGCLVYIFSLPFSGSTFLVNLRRQFCVRKIFSCTKIFRTQVFAGFAVLDLKLLFWKCVTYVQGWSFIKTCSLTEQVVNKCFCSSQWNSI